MHPMNVRAGAGDNIATDARSSWLRVLASLLPGREQDEAVYEHQDERWQSLNQAVVDPDSDADATLAWLGAERT